jgi:hypothetical protein
MVFKRLIGLVFAGALAFSAGAADFVIRIAPPRAVVERRPASPGRNYVWIAGYQNWNGNGYNWTPGRWEQPPQPRARWVAHRYTRQKGGGWVFVQGHWR